MDEMEVVAEPKFERVPVAGFEDDYYRYVAKRNVVEEEVKAEFEKVLAERTAKLDQLIELTSELVEVEPEVVDLDEENTETVE